MYIQDTGQSGKRARCVLLRESYWDKATKTVKNRTLSNLTALPDALIAPLKAALAASGTAAPVVPLETLLFRQGGSVGALVLLLALATRLGLTRALGSSFQGLLALWQVFARVLDQGSRLSAVRLARSHEVPAVLGFQRGFDEDDLYGNLDWIEEHQEAIETGLFQERSQGEPPTLFLYDVTSSYLEGTGNALGEYGYNRDKKKGKEQIVIGLLCDSQGVPLSVEVFPGNTQDLQTFSSQVSKAAERFGCRKVTFVGDRGMIKTPQQEELAEAGFSFISALTKPQVKTLLAAGTLQLDLFDGTIREVEAGGKRYVLRKNPVRATEIAATRAAKQAKIQTLVTKETAYLAGHPRAKPATAVKRIQARIARLGGSGWLTVTAQERTLGLAENPEALKQEAELDGCYVLVTDLPKAEADAQTVHDRYKDLAQVERAFRTMKTGHLEVRPVYVQTAAHTRGHVLVTMLAYLLRQALARCWADLDVTVEEGLAELGRVSVQEVLVQGQVVARKIPQPTQLAQALLAAATVSLPAALPHRPADIGTTTPLPSRRNLHKTKGKIQTSA